ncbi:MAG: hypothetical protein HGA78_10385 [Nitrospirales bacterium]|nr:hypothetical protein [Nitrospirales bacterium]
MKEVMGKTNVRTEIYLTKEEYDYLRRESEKKRVSIAEVVRQLIEERMPKESYEENPLFSIGKDGFTMGRARGSEEHDKYIYGQSGD